MPRSYRGSIHRRGWAVLRAEGRYTPNPFVMVDVMYLAFGALDALCLAFHQPSMAQTFFLRLFLRRVRDYPPRRGPGPPVMGVARAGRPPSRLHGRRDRAIIRLMNVSKSIPDCIDPWTDTLSNCLPLDEHHFAEVFPVLVSPNCRPSSVEWPDTVRDAAMLPSQ